MNVKLIADEIGRDLERMSCPEHGEKPVIKVSGFDDPQFKVTACCDVHGKRVLDKAIELMTEKLTKAAEDMLNNAFK